MLAALGRLGGPLPTATVGHDVPPADIGLMSEVASGPQGTPWPTTIMALDVLPTARPPIVVGPMSEDVIMDERSAEVEVSVVITNEVGPLQEGEEETETAKENTRPLAQDLNSSGQQAILPALCHVPTTPACSQDTVASHETIVPAGSVHSPNSSTACPSTLTPGSLPTDVEATPKPHPQSTMCGPCPASRQGQSPSGEKTTAPAMASLTIQEMFPHRTHSLTQLLDVSSGPITRFCSRSGSQSAVSSTTSGDEQVRRRKHKGLGDGGQDAPRKRK